MRKSPKVDYQFIRAEKRAKPWSRQMFINYIEEIWVDAILSYYQYALARNNYLEDTESAQQWLCDAEETLAKDLVEDLKHPIRVHFDRNSLLEFIIYEMVQVAHMSKNSALANVKDAFPGKEIAPLLSSNDTDEFIDMLTKAWEKTLNVQRN